MKNEKSALAIVKKRTITTIIFLCLMLHASGIGIQSNDSSFFILQSSFNHHDWEDQSILQIHREPARAAFFAYKDKPGDRQLLTNSC